MPLERACVRLAEWRRCVRRDLWCGASAKEGAFPSAEAAAAAGLQGSQLSTLLGGGCEQLSGPTTVLRAFVKNEDRFAPPVATGLVSVGAQAALRWMGGDILAQTPKGLWRIVWSLKLLKRVLITPER